MCAARLLFLGSIAWFTACAPARGQGGTPGPIGGPGLTDLESRRTIAADVSPADSLATVIRVGRMVFVSGQLPLGPSGDVESPRDLEAQARRAFENLATALRAAGARPADVVQLTVYVVGLQPGHPALIRATAAAFFPTGNPPTGAFLGVAALSRPDALVSVSALAMTPGLAIDRSVAQERRP